MQCGIVVWNLSACAPLSLLFLSAYRYWLYQRIELCIIFQCKKTKKKNDDLFSMVSYARRSENL